MESNPKVKVFISFNLYRSSVTSLTKELHVLAIDDNKKVTILTFISIHILIIISQVINGNGIVQKRYDDNGCINCFFPYLEHCIVVETLFITSFPPFWAQWQKCFVYWYETGYFSTNVKTESFVECRKTVLCWRTQQKWGIR